MVEHAAYLQSLGRTEVSVLETAVESIFSSACIWSFSNISQGYHPQISLLRCYINICKIAFNKMTKSKLQSSIIQKFPNKKFLRNGNLTLMTVILFVKHFSVTDSQCTDY